MQVKRIKFNNRKEKMFFLHIYKVRNINKSQVIYKRQSALIIVIFMSKTEQAIIIIDDLIISDFILETKILDKLIISFIKPHKSKKIKK